MGWGRGRDGEAQLPHGRLANPMADVGDVSSGGVVIMHRDPIANLAACPECLTSWQGEEIPPEHRGTSGLTHYSLLIGVEVLGGYDGISYWRCPHCAAEWNRWTGALVQAGNARGSARAAPLR